jgi:hypothetical protein
MLDEIGRGDPSAHEVDYCLTQQLSTILYTLIYFVNPIHDVCGQLIEDAYSFLSLVDLGVRDADVCIPHSELNHCVLHISLPFHGNVSRIKLKDDMYITFIS